MNKLYTSLVIGALSFAIMSPTLHGQTNQAQLALEVRVVDPQTVELAWTDPTFTSVIETALQLEEPGLWEPLWIEPKYDASQDRFSMRLALSEQTRFFRLRVWNNTELPPDPRSEAGPISPSVATDVGNATRFLWDGPNPVQRGVISSAMEPKRALVLRGLVIARDGSALAGARISVLGRPEFGYTLSRVDGRYDLAVNGGGRLTLMYMKGGYLTAQRTTGDLPWQDYIEMPTVALVMPDAVANAIDLAEGTPQVARGGAVLDDDGARQSTLFFPSGTGAEWVLPDGSVQPVQTLTVRATELTVGDNGPAAMPAELPPQVGYTYCVDLSADEMAAVGATGLEFDRPIFHYLENFLGFPVGGIVPVGFYDPDAATWVPSDNGLIVQIHSVSNGLANLDIDGSGTPADSEALTALSVTEEERQELAQLYAVGQSLWRVPIDHFSSWDFNRNIGPNTNATAPPTPDWVTQFQTRLKKLLWPDEVTCEDNQKSWIENQNQVLHESIPLTGVPFDLHYSSLRTPGRRAAYTLEFPVSFNELPPELKRIEVEIEVAGQCFQDMLPAETNQTYVFEWNGEDAYGRRLQGTHPVSIRVGYVYKAYYQEPGVLVRSFGHFGNGVPLSVDFARSEFTFWREWKDQLGTWDARGLDLGGWTLGVHHVYDPVGGVLWLGYGSRRSARSSAGPIVRPVAGGGDDASGEGIPAVDALLNNVLDLAVDPHGNVYLVNGSTIRRVGTDGLITTYAVDNAAIRGLALAPDGRLYFSEYSNQRHRVRVVLPDGTIRTVINHSGIPGFSGDGGPAIDAQLYNPTRLAMGSDGSLYILDSRNYRVRRVSPDGIINTVAGGGDSFADGILATEARLNNPQSIAISPEGILYIADWGIDTVRQVGLDGIITTLAPASRILDVTVALDGSVLVTGVGGTGGEGIAWFYRVNSDGSMTQLAGLDGRYDTGDYGPALNAGLSWPLATAVGPRGTIYFSANNRIREISQPLPWFNDEEIAIASKDGRLLYQFDRHGRHLQTVDTLTSAILYRFAYDTEGRLLNVDDGRGNVTTIERDAFGNPIAIVAPFGQRTELEVDANGYLQTVTDPAGRMTRVAHNADGLLTEVTFPGEGPSSFEYDASGRLFKDGDSSGGFVMYDRSDEMAAYEVASETAEGVEKNYRVEQLETGQTRLVNQLACCGASNEILLNRDESIDVAYADGTITHRAEGPDPRFGMDAPVLTELLFGTPGGVASAASYEVTAYLEDPLDPLSLIQITRTNDVNGRIYTSVYDATTRTSTSTTPEGRSSKVVLDEWGRPMWSETGGLEPMEIQYDARDRIAKLQQGAREISFSYDTDSGFLASVTNALMQTTRYDRDVLGRVTAVTLPDDSEWDFDWDEAGDLERITEPDHITFHEFTWTDHGQLASYRSPLGATNRFYYDLDRRLQRRELPSGEAIEWSYDSAGRFNALTLPEGTNTFHYDGASGQLTNVVSLDEQQITFAYDGALLTNATWTGVASGEVAHHYDHDLRLDQITYGGQTLNLDYDGDNLLTNAAGIALERDDASGLTTALTDGNLRIDYGHDAYGWLASVHAVHDAAALYDAEMGFDDLGRMTNKQETIAGMTHAWAYAYDAQGRFTQVRKDGVVVESYTYDAVGNRIGMTSTARGIARTSADYEYDADHKLLHAGNESYEYDANGRLARKTVGTLITEYHYRADGVLRQVDLPDGRVITYRYDSAHRRVAKVVDGVVQRRWVYGSGLTPLAEYNGDGTLRTVYAYPGSALPAAFVRNRVRYRVIKATTHSPLLIIAEDGTVAKRVDYDAFGCVLDDTNPALDFPFGFTGGLADPETGLVQLGFRDYDPATGRWTAKDPILFAGDSHLYAYCANDPVNRVDRDGLAIKRRKWEMMSKTSNDAAESDGVYGCRPSSLEVASEIYDTDAVPPKEGTGTYGYRPSGFEVADEMTSQTMDMVDQEAVGVYGHQSSGLNVAIDMDESVKTSTDTAGVYGRTSRKDYASDMIEWSGVVGMLPGSIPSVEGAGV